MYRLTSVFLFLLLAPVGALAQYNPLTEDNPSVSQIPTPPSEKGISFEPKSKKTAKMLTVAVPAGAIALGSLLLSNEINTTGVILIAGGIIVAPSAGNFYAQNPESVVKGIGTRLLGGGLAAVGGYLSLVEALGRAFGGPGHSGVQFTGAILFLGGSGLIVYSFFYDLFNSPKNVEKYNNANQDKSFAISPTYFPKEKAPG